MEDNVYEGGYEPDYGTIAWSENPIGYSSGYGMDMLDEDNSSGSCKGSDKGQRPREEKGLGRMIYDSQDGHPFCFGTGMSSSF